MHKQKTVQSICQENRKNKNADQNDCRKVYLRRRLNRPEIKELRRKIDIDRNIS